MVVIFPAADLVKLECPVSAGRHRGASIELTADVSTHPWINFVGLVNRRSRPHIAGAGIQKSHERSFGSGKYFR